MKGLLLKDFYIIQDSLLMLFIIFVVTGAAMAFLISPWVLMSMTATTLSIIAITTIQNDKSTQWNKFSATLPISRIQIISSKYCLYLLLCAMGVVLGLIVSVSASILKSNFDINSLLLNLYLAIIVSLIPGSISIPCSFLIEEEKIIVGIVLSYIATAVLLIGFTSILRHFINMEDNMNLVYGIITVVSVVVYLLSWLICPKKLCNRDI